MILYPAIDLMDGKAVRLRQGARHEVTVYGDPEALAAHFRDSGATWLHLVDLDAAFDGSTRCLPLIERIVHTFRGNVELGGGLRSAEDIRLRMEAGVTCAIIGSAAVRNPELVVEAEETWPGRIVAGIDARQGMVAIHGWVETSRVRALDLALRMKEARIRRIIYTDVARDGMMQGPNLEETRALVQGTGMQIVASGGIASLEDIRNAGRAGCSGVILGRAYYEGAVSLEDALLAVKEFDYGVSGTDP